MRHIGIALLLCTLLAGCGEPEPRRPVQVKSGRFFKTSIERSKKILQAETLAIKRAMEKDSLRSYHPSANGFWYAYEQKKDSTPYLPKTNDVLFLNYDLMTLDGDTLYPATSIGLVEHAVDKSKGFPGLRNAVKLLGQGERATFLFPSSLGYGYKGDGNKIGPNTVLRSNITILEIQRDSSNINQ